MIRLFALLALMLASPAVSAPACGPHAAISGQLEAKYHETLQARASDTKGRLVEVYASIKNGTWTITVTPPGGLTCIVAAGQGYEAVDVPVGERL